MAAVLSAGLAMLDAPLQAESGDSGCRTARGRLVEVFDPTTGSTSGTLENAGWLNGLVEAAFNSAVFPTPDPNKVTFSSTLTIATPHGTLRGARRTYLFDFVTGNGSDVTDIDPDGSTGRFAGATGVLYSNLLESESVATGPYHSVFVARVCLPRDGQHD
jgi:hypothetical protein